jgi:hypothetical protein
MSLAVVARGEAREGPKRVSRDKDQTRIRYLWESIRDEMQTSQTIDGAERGARPR